MDYNSFSYYRANPYAHNGFIPDASMTNRKPKLFPSEIPQGEEHLTSRPGRRIFKDKIQVDEIQRNNLLQSPQRYPFQNRIAYNKSFRRNLETVDIEGAAAGTKVSESVRNRIKALQVLREKDYGGKHEVLTKSRLIGQSLDAVNQKKRRQLAQQMSKNTQTKKSSEKTSPNDNKTTDNIKVQHQRLSEPKNPKLQIVDDQYRKYILQNSNQKYIGSIPGLKLDGFQRYKRPQNQLGTFRSENQQQSSRVENSLISERDFSKNTTNNRGQSIEQNKNQPSKNMLPSILDSPLMMKNRYHHIDYNESYSKQKQRKMQQIERTKKMESTIKQIFLNDKKEFRRHNPTNLSFNIAARNSLMSTIV